MPSVLVVEDERDSAEFVTRFLERKGYAVTWEIDGHAAMKSLIYNTPDVVVLDVRMPKVNGVSLLETMRSYLRWYDLPVVLLTAHATPADLARARELGVRHVLHKANFTLHDLGEAVEELTGVGRRVGQDGGGPGASAQPL
jgi:CheY-like chemotaxis protein